VRRLPVSGVLVRRLASCLFLGLVVALITGATGTGEHPLRAARLSLVDPRVLGYLGAGVLVFAVWTLLGGERSTALRTAARTRTRGLDGLAGRAPARYTTYLGLLAAAILVPQALPTYLQQAAFSFVGIYALLALGLNVVVGYAGLLDLGFIAFYAIGAYTTSYFSYTSVQRASGATPLPVHAPFHLNGFFILPIAAAVAALAGVILGGPTLRLRGDYLAIVTLGFGEIIQLLANTADGVTNGSRGAFGTPHLRIHLPGIDKTIGDNPLDPLPNYYLVLIVVVLVMVALSRLERSRIGRAWSAIREDEVAAAASGVPTLRFKLLAFAIGASTSGFAGVIFASSQFYDPKSFTYQASILVLTVVIFGGMGSVFGAVAGAVVLQGLSAYLEHAGIVPAQDSFIFLGAIVMLMMVFRPQGLVASRRRSREITLSEAGVGAADALGPAEGRSA